MRSGSMGNAARMGVAVTQREPLDMQDDLTVAAQSGLPIAAPLATDPMVRAPKFKNTENPAETWVGRGRRPRWLKDHLAAGRSLDEFRIQR
jgi:DNA-binding protein H-NS